MKYFRIKRGQYECFYNFAKFNLPETLTVYEDGTAYKYPETLYSTPWDRYFFDADYEEFKDVAKHFGAEINV